MLIWVWRNLLSSLNLAPRLRKYTVINTKINYTIKESIHPTNNTLSDALPHNVRLIAMLSSKVRTSAESRLSGQNAQDWLSPAGWPSVWSYNFSQLIQQSKWFIIQHIRFSGVRVSRAHRGRVSWMYFGVLPAENTQVYFQSTTNKSSRRAKFVGRRFREEILHKRPIAFMAFLSSSENGILITAYVWQIFRIRQRAASALVAQLTATIFHAIVLQRID